VAGQEGSIVVLRERAHMGFGDGKSCGDRGGNLTVGGTLVLPQPAHVHADIIAIRGARRREAQGCSRVHT
jgi:hypothetical protein